MGRRSKLRSNPSLADAHAAGAKVYIMQLLVHDRFGAIAYAWPRHWMLHYSAARRGARDLSKCHDKVLQHEPGPNAMRAITDEELLEEVYDAGNTMVSHAVRAVQHLAEEIERNYKTQLRGQTIEERINEAAALFSTQPYNLHIDYSGLAEVVGVRDALEHPQAGNTHNTDPNAWDRVPLAWMLSNRSLDAWGRFDRWFKRLSGDWDAHLPTLSKPGTITVQRDIESLSPFKKAPRQEA
jgi:hypothetical protein